MIMSNEVTFTNLGKYFESRRHRNEFDTKDSKIYMHKIKDKVIITNNKNSNN